MTKEQILETYGDYNFYLYSQHAAWLAPTKVNIYYGIWKRIIKSIGNGAFCQCKDELVESESGDIKFFGLAEIEKSSLETVIDSVAGDADNVLFFSKKDFSNLYDQIKKLAKIELIEIDFFNAREKFSIFRRLISSEEIVFQVVYIDDALFLEKVRSC